MAIYCSEGWWFDSGSKTSHCRISNRHIFPFYSVQISEPAKVPSTFLSWKEKLQILVKYVINVNFCLLLQIHFSTPFEHLFNGDIAFYFISILFSNVSLREECSLKNAIHVKLVSLFMCFQYKTLISRHISTSDCYIIISGTGRC